MTKILFGVPFVGWVACILKITVTPRVTCDNINGQALQEGVLLCDPGWSVCTAVVEEEAGGEKTDGGRCTSSTNTNDYYGDGFVRTNFYG